MKESDNNNLGRRKTKQQGRRKVKGPHGFNASQENAQGATRLNPQRKPQTKPQSNLQDKACGGRGSVKKRQDRRKKPTPPIFSPEQIDSRTKTLGAVRISNPDLPVVARFDEIAGLLTAHSVIVVAGETGSGKSTQLPQLLLREGYGARGYIGLTQPRRIAATALAATLNEQVHLDDSLSQPVIENEQAQNMPYADDASSAPTDVADSSTEPLPRASEVAGYQIRFQSTTKPKHLIKVMTDGVLLTEIRRDKRLLQYEVIIIDEAHERSTNIDLLLGYLKQLVTQRNDLKIIVTSATLDHQRFQAFFGGAPLLEVTGRQYPVEIRYEDVGEILGERSDSPEAVAWAVQEILPLLGEGDLRGRDGLVFLPTERHIQAASRHLRKHMPPHISVLPLYARLPQAEQQKIFHPTGRTRIILTTNVAETSLTVPNIGFVIDTGTARISQYSVHNKVQRLPIEAISQSSAAQRAGRCGRVGPGVCLRLYSENDFQKREHHTKPEILRSHLASVLVQLLYLRLGDPERFSFLDQPDSRLMRDGFQCLMQIGAVSASASRKDDVHSAPKRRRYQLTSVGRQIAQLPLDPRLARILLAAGDFNCLEEQLILVSFLGVQDPRERSFWEDVRQAQCFKAFYDDESDFMAILKLWQWAQTERADQTRRGFQKSCRALGISIARYYEWSGLHRQLVLWAQKRGMSRNTTPASYEQIHRALLCGWPLEVATLHPEGYYQGVRGRKLQIFPGNPLKRKKFPWLLVGEIIETEKQFAHRVAKVDPQWVEAAAGDLVKRHMGEPFWDKKRQQVRVHERGELLGLQLYAKRARSLSGINPEAARFALIRFALVERLWHSSLPFEQKNKAVLGLVDQWEHKIRRLDLRADDEVLLNFFDARLPADITDCRRLKRWATQQRQGGVNGAPKKGVHGDALCFSLSDILAPFSLTLDVNLWPDSWLPRARGNDMVPFELSYLFDMSHERDGITLHVPESRMNALCAAELTWLVPGYWPDLLGACVRALPKVWRRRVPPLPNWREDCIRWLRERASGVGGAKGQPDRQESFQAALSVYWQQAFSVTVPLSEFDETKLPAWLRFWISVKGLQGNELAAGRDWEAVSGQTVRHAQEIDLGQALPSVEPTSAGVAALPDGEFKSWTFGNLPRELTDLSSGASQCDVKAGYCAFVDQGDAVQVSAFSQQGAAEAAHLAGLTRLYLLRATQAVRTIKKDKSLATLALALGMTREAFIVQTLAKTVQQCFLAHQADWYSQTDFDQCWEIHRNKFVTTHQALTQILSKLASQVALVRRRLMSLTSPALSAPKAAIDNQLDALLSEDFIVRTPAMWLARYPVYFEGMLARMDRLQGNLQRDAQDEAVIQSLKRQFDEAVAQRAFPSEALQSVRWQLEELRLSFFAQRLKTHGKVSPKRVQKILDENR